MNLNATCRVTLTDAGMAALLKYWAGITVKPPGLEGDVLTNQLHSIMRIFGPMTLNGMPETPFKGNVVEIEVEAP